MTRDELLDQMRRESSLKDYSGDWREFEEKTEFWETPHFVVADVCKIAGATPKALEHFINPKRGLVELEGDSVNPGTGKRRMFTGKHVLIIAAAYYLNKTGFPQRWSKEISSMVGEIAITQELGIFEKTNLKIVNYPLETGDWQFHLIYDELQDRPELPVATLWLDVDRLIKETRKQLMKIVARDEGR